MRHPRNVARLLAHVKRLARAQQRRSGLRACPFCEASNCDPVVRFASLLSPNGQSPRRSVARSFGFDPDPDELVELLGHLSIAQIARLYGVSRRDVQKRCQALGIPGCAHRPQPAAPGIFGPEVEP